MYHGPGFHFLRKLLPKNALLMAATHCECALKPQVSCAGGMGLGSLDFLRKLLPNNALLTNTTHTH